MNATAARFADVTAEWLTEVLRSGAPSAAAAVTGLAIEPLSTASAIGDLGRARLEYSPAGAPGPASVVLKARGADARRQELDRAMGLFARERHFYVEFGPRVPIRTPRLLHAGDGDRTPLVLEDLGGLRAGNQLIGLSIDDAERTIDALGDLHAAYWGIDGGWLLSMEDPAFAGMWQYLINSGMPAVQERFAASLPAPTLAALARVGEKWIEVMSTLNKGPSTLVHNDCRLDNLVFADDGTPIFIDWQTPSATRGTQDVAHLLSASMESDLLRDNWETLLRRYHERLVSGGVTGYDWSACLEHYRQNVVYAVASGIAMLGSLAMPDTRDLGGIVVQRVLTHAADLDSFALV